MLKRKERIAYKMLWKWVLSYLLALLIMFSLILVISNYLLRQLEEQVESTMISSVNQLVSRMDSIYLGFERLMTDISMNENVSTLYSVVGSQRPYHQYIMYKTILDLKLYHIAYDFLDADSPLLYINNRNGDQYLLNPNAKYELLLYHQVSGLFRSISFVQWIELLENAPGSISYIVLPGLENENYTNNTICMLKALNITMLTKPGSAVFIKMNMDKLALIIREANFLEDSKIVLMDKNTDVIISVNQNGFENSSETYPFLEGAFMRHENDIVVSVASSVNGFKYQYIVPKSVYLRHEKSVKTIIYLSILSIFLIGSIVVYLVTKRRLEPLSILTNRIIGRMNRQPRSNEILNLKQYVDEIIDDNVKINNIIDEQNDMMKPFFLQQLLRGYINDDDDFHANCTKLGIVFPYDNYAVIAFDVIPNEQSSNIDNEHSIICFAIRNISEELFNRIFVCYVFQDGAYPVCIVNFHLYPADFATQVKNILTQVITVIMDGFKVDVLSYISTNYPSYQGIAMAYSELLRMIDYRRLFNNKPNNIIISTTEMSSKTGRGLFTIEQQQLFLNYIKIKNYDQAKIYMNDIIDETFSRGISLEQARCCMFAIINTMINAISDISQQIDEVFFDQLKPYEKLLDCTNISMLKEQMNALLDALKCYIENDNNRNISERITDINHYIKANYTDANFNVSMIAYNYNTSISSLSRFYKRNTGTGLLDEINRCRIEKAKELLNQNYSVKAVANTVGFINSNAFIRTFKNYEGMTPGQYKSL